MKEQRHQCFKYKWKEKVPSTVFPALSDENCNSEDRLRTGLL